MPSKDHPWGVLVGVIVLIIIITIILFIIYVCHGNYLQQQKNNLMHIGRWLPKINTAIGKQKNNKTTEISAIFITDENDADEITVKQSTDENISLWSKILGSSLGRTFEKVLTSVNQYRSPDI